jgi:hypothetical protein
VNAVLETFMQDTGTSCVGCHITARLSRHQSKKTTPLPENATSYSFMFSYARAKTQP